MHFGHLEKPLLPSCPADEGVGLQCFGHSLLTGSRQLHLSSNMGRKHQGHWPGFWKIFHFLHG